MYGVPQDLDLSSFIDATLIQVCLGEFDLQFRFQSDTAATDEGPAIGVEGGWELRDDFGNVVDRAMPHEDRETYKLHRLLGLTVVSTEVDPPGSFTLRFSNGDELQIFDDSEQYETFWIQPGDIFV